MNLLLISHKVPALLAEWVETVITSTITFLLAMNVLLLIVGCVMDIMSAIVILAPLLVSLGRVCDTAYSDVPFSEFVIVVSKEGSRALGAPFLIHSGDNQTLAFSKAAQAVSNASKLNSGCRAASKTIRSVDNSFCIAASN
ncbi:TRAP transporter, DctM subunit [Ruegeria denitrificans]|uniref:TRAP transporter, DctM subunit n=1 Tax=Ruegeria denitrificans TaxID=1715692 RepID=A0A0N7M978_9RHOB|nr:TRAP transporter, DctM subunit [Ruegeria denitrificans]